MKNRGSYLLCAIIIVSLLPRAGYAFDGNAHEALSLRAVNPNVANASQLDSYLKNVLGFDFQDGVKEVVSSGKTVEKLIADGSVQEDIPFTRVVHHFHDPTRAWAQAGERFLGIPLGNSSVVWSQMSPQGACCGNFAWKDARDAYFNALTSTSDSERKFWYAQTFRTLGHLIHHVQDAAVPSHTRNDNHLQLFKSTKFPDGDPFHHWADSVAGRDLIGVSQALRFDPSILNQASPNPLAPVPVARIIDKTDGDLGILSPNVNIGLAEYSNANFISKGTSRSTTYQYPSYSQLEFGTVETLPNGKKVRYAKFRPGFGEQDYRVGVSSRMVQFVNATVPPDSIDFGLDDNVHEDYGRKLFPRAIGYSAGLIDYFFQNFMSGSAQDLGCGFLPFPSDPPRDFGLGVGTFRFDTLLPGEQPGTGRVVIVVQYRSGGQNHYFTLLDTTATLDPELGVGWTLSTGDLAQVPADATNVSYVIAYRGPLGEEPDAVIGGVGYFYGLC